MARFLFVVPPFTGHINPTLAVGRALVERGHRVAWAGHPSALEPLLAPGCEVWPLPEDELLARLAALRAQPHAPRGLQAFKQLWEEVLLPLARSMAPAVDAATASFQPDVLLVDQQALAGALVARKRRLKWATLATTSAQLADSLADLPLVKRWVDEQVAILETEWGLSPSGNLGLSPERLVVFSSEALAGEGRFPSQACFVGPAFEGRPETGSFPWDRLDDRPRLFVSLGTINAARGAPLYRVLAQALATEAIQVILVAPSEEATEMPPNFLVLPRVPQLALLPKVQAVLCHGGHNTMCEALAHGLPVIAMPIRDDQPVIAQQVVDAGAGLRLRFGRTQPEELRRAVRQALGDPALRAGAARIRDSFQRAGGARAAAEHLEALA
jgi:MGT family glycosyltransferase